MLALWPPPAEWSKAPQSIVEPPSDIAEVKSVAETPPTKTPRRRKTIDEEEIKRWLSKQEQQARESGIEWGWLEFIGRCEDALDKGGLFSDRNLARSLWDRLDLDVRQPAGRPRKTRQ